MEMTISIISAIIAIIAAFISYHSLTEQKRLSIWTTNYTRLIDAEEMMKNNPELLAFHGITQELLDECNASAIEVIYLLKSFRVVQEEFRLKNPNKRFALSKYRKNVLENKKAKKIWEKILSKKLMFGTKFIDTVNDYILDCNK